jgi:hypothetical protein
MENENKPGTMLALMFLLETGEISHRLVVAIEDLKLAVVCVMLEQLAEPVEFSVIEENDWERIDEDEIQDPYSDEFYEQENDI